MAATTAAADSSIKRQHVSSDFIQLSGIPTHVMKYGKLDLNPDKYLILVIPGNPGIIEYYEHYMEELFTQSNCQIPVWGIAHAGHVKVPKHIKYSEPDADVYSLDGQIAHKIEFIERHVPRDAKLIFVSHSIGSRIALEIMKRKPELNVVKSLLLFPTIEYMAESQHGQIAFPLLRYLRWLAILIVTILSYLSPIVQYRIVRWYFQTRAVARCAYNASLNLFDPISACNSMYLALKELEQVREPDLQTIGRYSERLIVYYGAVDHWCPLAYYERMKERFPAAEIYLCQQGFEHAFVLESSEQMAEMSWHWIARVVGHSNNPIGDAINS
ncbi:lipid droplet-associated hydrolase-like [Tubulanus polymorphus]|uniref:lipid droplet-associated hydrolase-like n=1 Tax=Tubulanus polymorphus TaxID=672921 RepID=UPI003DA3F947